MSKKQRAREHEARNKNKGCGLVAVIILFVILILMTLFVERLTIEMSLSGIALLIIFLIGIYCMLTRNK